MYLGEFLWFCFVNFWRNLKLRNRKGETSKYLKKILKHCSWYLISVFPKVMWEENWIFFTIYFRKYTSHVWFLIEKLIISKFYDSYRAATGNKKGISFKDIMWNPRIEKDSKERVFNPWWQVSTIKISIHVGGFTLEY